VKYICKRHKLYISRDGPESTTGGQTPASMNLHGNELPQKVSVIEADGPESSMTEQKPASPHLHGTALPQRDSGNGDGGRIRRKPDQLELVQEAHLEMYPSEYREYMGLCTLRDGRIAVVELYNDTCTILSPSLQPLGQPYTFKNHPHGVTCFGDNRLAVINYNWFVYSF